MISPLINTSSYNGKYVAMKSFEDHTIVGEGSSPQEAFNKAVKKGCGNPVITFIPIKGVVQIY